ncbi:hypothetical protein DINM_021989 [Dirofilaria immitis]|nr:hypothetical protein [Dirofilaria immitis]
MEGIEESGDTGQSLEWNAPDTSSILPSIQDISSEPPVNSGPYDSARYLDELIKDMRILDAIQVQHPNTLRHTYALLTTEIDRIWSLIYTRTLRDEQMLTFHHSQVTTNNGWTSNHDPRENYDSPTPRLQIDWTYSRTTGISVKQLEAQTECRILIRGRGSVKDARREARLRNRIGWEHLSEPLHVLITATDFSHDRCAQKLTNGIYNIKALLSSNDDEHKRRQLVQLAIINGTYRAARP